MAGAEKHAEHELEVAYSSLELEPGTMEVARVDADWLVAVVEDEKGAVEFAGAVEGEAYADTLPGVEDEAVGSGSMTPRWRQRRGRAQRPGRRR